MILENSPVIGQQVTYNGIEYTVTHVRVFENTKTLHMVDKNGNPFQMSPTTFRKYRALDGLESNFIKRLPLLCSDCEKVKKKRCPVCADLRKNRDAAYRKSLTKKWQQQNTEVCC